MDVAVSVSLLKDQLGSVIEHAVRAAVEMVLTEMATLMGSKFEDIRKEMKAKEKENESMKQMLEISRCQMKTLRKYMSAVGAKDERHAATPRKSWKEPEPHRHYCPDVAAPLALKRTRKEPGTAAFSKTMKDLLESNACVSPIALQTQRCGGALPDVSSRTVPGRCSGAPASSPAQIDPHQPCRTGDTTDGTRVKEESRDVADAEGAAQRNTAEHQEPLSEKDRGAGGKGATEGTPSEVKGQESPKHYSPVVDPELGSVRIKEEVAEIETVCIKEEPDEAGHTSQGQCADACALDSLGFIKDECHVPQSRLEEGSTASVRFTNSAEEGDSSLATVCFDLSPGGNVKGETGIAKKHEAEDKQGVQASSARVPTSETPSITKTPPSCSECGKTFRHAGSLKTHQRIHTGEKPYSCSECGRSFKQSGDLKIHQRIHSGEKPYQCMTCGKSFNRKGYLKTHQRTHTGESPYSCDDCGKSFGRVDILKAHQRTHTGETPFSCPECGKKFKQPGDLKIHQRIHTGEKPYHCGECGKNFSQLTHLKTHRRIHSGEKPFHCPQCSKGFRESGALRRHQRIHRASLA